MKVNPFAILFAVTLMVSANPQQNVEDLIDEINSSQELWKAAPNHITAMDLLGMKKLLGAKRSEDISNYHVRTLADYDIDETNIPKKFDARQKWSHCPSILSIKDQSTCGSCWAVSTASAISDRLCIASKFKVKVNISAENLVSCCTECGEGCRGGYPDKAWDYFNVTGLPTGGDYGSNEGCQPYEIAPHRSDPVQHLPPFPKVSIRTPACHPKKCTNKKYHKHFNKDKYYGKSSYFIRDVKVMQAEIMKYGPIVVGFDVYEDFMTYESGVYKYVKGELLGGHAVRVLGWGTEKGTDYWLVANSWNRHWGENGLFKFIRGTNNCEFETYVTAGLVKPK